MENELDEVEAGKENYVDLLRDFYGDFETALDEAETSMEGQRVKIKDEETDIVCDKCGRKMVIKIGRFGKFLACPGFPECTNTKAITEDTGASCPVCGMKVVKKKSARGYVYYSCDKYPECSFITWDKPLKTKCPTCDSSLFRHTDRDSKEVTDVCLREGCGYKELVKEGLPPEEAEKETVSAVKRARPRRPSGKRPRQPRPPREAACLPKPGKKKSPRKRRRRRKPRPKRRPKQRRRRLQPKRQPRPRPKRPR